MGKGIELEIGSRYGRWTVLKKGDTKPGRGLFWLCRCDCGTERLTTGRVLRDGQSRSCGCLMKELASKRFQTHGQTHSGFGYSNWNAMIQRCTNPNSSGYPKYGGAGISVCDRWLHSFEFFFQDMGPKPSPKHSIDRFPNKNGNYEPGNCRWATQKQQLGNVNKNVWIEHKGKKMILSDWARHFKTPRGVLRLMIKRHSFEWAYDFYSRKKKGLTSRVENLGQYHHPKSG